MKSQLLLGAAMVAAMIAAPIDLIAQERAMQTGADKTLADRHDRARIGGNEWASRGID